MWCAARLLVSNPSTSLPQTNLRPRPCTHPCFCCRTPAAALSRSPLRTCGSAGGGTTWRLDKSLRASKKAAIGQAVWPKAASAGRACSSTRQAARAQQAPTWSGSRKEMATRMKPPAAPPPAESNRDGMPGGGAAIQRERNAECRLRPSCLCTPQALRQEAMHTCTPFPPPSDWWAPGCVTHPACTAQSTCPQGPPPGCPATKNKAGKEGRSHHSLGKEAAAMATCKAGQAPGWRHATYCCCCYPSQLSDWLGANPAPPLSAHPQSGAPTFM